MSSSVTGTQTMYGLGDLMGTCCPPEGESKPPLTAAEAAILVLAAFFLVSWGLLSWWSATQGQSVWAWLIASTVPALLLLVGAAVLHRRFAVPLHHAGRRAPLVLISLGSGLLCFAGGYLIGPTPPSALAPLLDATGQYLWALLWVCLAVPLIEEFFFRGVLQGALERSMPHPLAVIPTAVGFMLVHYGMPMLSLWLFIGLWLGAVRWLTRSIIPAVVGHIAWNLGTVFFADRLVNRTELRVVIAFALLLAINGAVLAVSGGKRPRGTPSEA